MHSKLFTMNWALFVCFLVFNLRSAYYRQLLHLHLQHISFVCATKSAQWEKPNTSSLMWSTYLCHLFWNPAPPYFYWLMKMSQLKHIMVETLLRCTKFKKITRKCMSHALHNWRNNGLSTYSWCWVLHGVIQTHPCLWQVFQKYSLPCCKYVHHDNLLCQKPCSETEGFKAACSTIHVILLKWWQIWRLQDCQGDKSVKVIRMSLSWNCQGHLNVKVMWACRLCELQAIVTFRVKVKITVLHNFFLFMTITCISDIVTTPVL